MASVQELIDAERAQRSPAISAMEGLARGYLGGQQQALERAKTLIMLEQNRREQGMRMREQEMMIKNQESLSAQIAKQMDDARKQEVNAAGEKKGDLTPQQKTKTVWEQNEKGQLSRKIEFLPTDSGDGLDTEYKKARTDYFKERTGDVKEQQDERDYKRRERRNAERTRVIDRFNSDPSVKKSQQTFDSASMIKDLISSENPIAAGAIPTFMARASGEVGALSEADKAPFGGSRAIIARLEAAATQAANGKLTADNAAFIGGLADIMQQRAKSNINSLASKRARQYSGASDFLTEDDIIKTLVPDMEGDATDKAEGFPQGQKDGKKKAVGRWNPKTGKVEKF